MNSLIYIGIGQKRAFPILFLIIGAVLALALEPAVLLAVAVAPQELALAELGPPGGVLAFISDTAESLVLALANSVLVKVPAVNLAHYIFSMCLASAW